MAAIFRQPVGIFLPRILFHTDLAEVVAYC